MTKKILFSNREDFINFLRNYFSDISEVDELELFAHQVNDWRDFIYGEDPMEKTNGILKSGLSASKYGSTDGTLTRMGSILDGDVIDKIIDYDYHGFKKLKGQNCFPTVILAFPKKVKINGSDVDFTDSEYTTDHGDYDKKISQSLQNGGAGVVSNAGSQFTPKTWLDVIHCFRNYSAEDNLMAFYKDEKQMYNLILPESHWIFQGREEYERHKASISKKIEEEGCDLPEAIRRKVQENQWLVDSALDEI